jgi:AcrR family transcriptional regulator
MAPPADIDRYLAERATPGSAETRIITAALRCISRWGVAKTTADDIARDAGISRATLYRAFPGGRDVVLSAVLRHEVGRFFATVSSQLDEADDLEDLLVRGLVEADAFLRDHGALRYLIVHEPERVLPGSALERLSRVVALAAAFAEPHLARFVDPDRARAAAELVTRIGISYALVPSTTVALSDPVAVRDFVRAHLLPGLAATTVPSLADPVLANLRPTPQEPV